MAAVDMTANPAASQFVYLRTYARWIEEEKRREGSWEETADRYFTFMKGRYGEKVPKKVWAKAEEKVKTFGTMPSMRAAASAGPALERNHIAGYNCAYVPFVDLRAVAELFYILMNAAGSGFSTESEYIGFGAEDTYTHHMPVVATQTGDGAGVFVIPDSKEGWADALFAGLEAWFAGKDIEFDFSLIRPRGTRLKTFGGRASGPRPLKKLLNFTRDTVLAAQGRRLDSLEWLDIGNMIGDVVVVGGVRRSSEINFSDLDDAKIRNAKTGTIIPPHRFISNNSAVFHEKPTATVFMREWLALAESGRGERGIFNLYAIEKHFKKHAKRREFRKDLRSNPCGEILLRPFQFCNLTELVVRATDTFDDLIEKMEVAVWLGAMQAGLTDFKWIRPEFKKNCEEEALLGVSLTGQMDNPGLMTPEKLAILKEYAIKTARKASKALGINMSVAITTGKPSGTVSQLVQCGSGAHPWHDKFFIRRYRIASTDPIFMMMKAQGFKFFPENGQSEKEHRDTLLSEGWKAEEITWDESMVQTWVVEFPLKAPEGALTRQDVTAIDQLEWYVKLMENYCEHNQSITVYVRDDEWLKVGAWVYDHFEKLLGVTFLPHDGGKYKLAPYETITEAEYDKRVSETPDIDWTKLTQFELEDSTTGAQALACAGNSCELN